MHMGNLMELTPRLNFASRDRARAGDRWGPRTIPDWQIFSVVSGEALLKLGRQTYRIRPGESVLYGPNSPHDLSAEMPTEYFSFHFSWHETSPAPVHPAYRIQNVPAGALTTRPESCGVFVPGVGEMEIPPHFPTGGLDAIMFRMVKEYHDEAAGNYFLLRAMLMELLVLLIRQLARQHKGAPASKIEPALAAIRDNPGAKWSVCRLAEMCGYHPSYFTGLFFQEVGQNPKEYLIAERVRQAKTALLKGEPVEQIAESLGYASIHYFSSSFKKATGLSPSEFKQNPTTLVHMLAVKS
ncbi:AraC-type DNA-binding protein [Paenibacillus sp. UNC496MF]|uniref:helix-turn-helix transcriptional regulator n=1 Tax=Paenibacillus sp. UNC496MF TaxID=1502753 RepID=UPI0008E4220C|nr:AraC family transcriptional regulator [Paenibacillus sp. UNC496MF]SFI73613.1 AraC-type DNA-binding protein [Paenibacillus sp. UNC496MF]